MRWSKGALIEVAPCTCIGAEKNCLAAYLKLLFGVVNDRLWRWVEAVVRSEGIPCLQSRVGSVIKALQPTLDVPSWNAKRSFSETNSVVSNVQNNVNALPFLHGVLVSNGLNWHSWSPHHSRYIYGLRRFPPACMAIAFEQVLSGSPHMSLDRLLTFRGSEGSSGIILCNNNTAEVVCQGRYFARAKHTDVKLSLQQFRCCLKLTPKPEGAY